MFIDYVSPMGYASLINSKRVIREVNFFLAVDQCVLKYCIFRRFYRDPKVCDGPTEITLFDRQTTSLIYLHPVSIFLLVQWEIYLVRYSPRISPLQRLTFSSAPPTPQI